MYTYKKILDIDSEKNKFLSVLFHIVLSHYYMISGNQNLVLYHLKEAKSLGFKLFGSRLSERIRYFTFSLVRQELGGEKFQVHFYQEQQKLLGALYTVQHIDHAQCLYRLAKQYRDISFCNQAAGCFEEAHSIIKRPYK